MSDSVVACDCSSYQLEKVEESLQRIFIELGGAEKYFSAGDRILLKPNMLASHEVSSCVTTNPALIEGLIRIAQAHGAIPIISDSPAFGTARGVAKCCRIAQVADKYGVEIIEMKQNCKKIRDEKVFSDFLEKTPAANQKKIERLSRISKTAFEFDRIINLPKLKVHVQMGFSGAVKNNYGFISGKVKALRHFAVHDDVDLFAQVILGIYKRALPDLSIVDAVDMLDVRGPSGGEPLHVGKIFAAENAVLLDDLLYDLFKQPKVGFPVVENARRYANNDLSGNPLLKGDWGFTLSHVTFPEKIPVSFTLPRVLKSLLRHIFRMLMEKKK